MASLGLIPATIGLLWAGLSLGGSLIAAPAKFRAPSLDLPTALEVGRAQFRWLANTEWVFLIFLVSSLIWPYTSFARVWFALPILIFLIQRFVIMPKLDALTTDRIAGNAPSSSHLHITYVAAEGFKFLSLVGVSIILLKTLMETL